MGLFGKDFDKELVEAGDLEKQKRYEEWEEQRIWREIVGNTYFDHNSTSIFSGTEFLLKTGKPFHVWICKVCTTLVSEVQKHEEWHETLKTKVKK